MSNSRHTPGPWRVGPGDPKTENHVANVRGLDIYGGYAAVSCGDDASLIAAAPELLAALKEILEGDCSCPLCQAAYAAVAKAESTPDPTERAATAARNAIALDEQIVDAQRERETGGEA